MAQNPQQDLPYVPKNEIQHQSKQERLLAHLERARSLARWLDDLVSVPGTRFRVGLDPLFSLVPVAGDGVSALFSGYLIVVGARLGVPPAVIAQMVLNVGLDLLVGIVPVLGDLFDMVWKSNRRNLALLERFVLTPTLAHRSSRVVVAVAALALLALVAMVVGAFFAVGMLVTWLLQAVA
jgi:hypothetical protein